MSDTGRRYDDSWLVVPLYNEATVIGQVIDDAKQSFPNIVCIDDGSSDDSAEIARNHGARVINHPFNLGQGAALQTGMEYVRRHTNANYIVTFDADGQLSVPDAPAMVDRARAEDLAIIFGSRFLDDATKVGWSKKLVLKTAAAVTKARTGLNLTDAHNGLRLLRCDALQRVDLRQDGMAHASEIVSQLADTGLPWAEMPVHIAYTDYSKAKGQSLLNSVNILVDLVMR